MSEREGPIRLAVVGGRRGSAFKHALNTMPHRVVLTAVCELNETVLQEWQTQYPGIKAYKSYDKLLDDPEIDAVLLATPLLIHASQAVQALRAGKHVLSEVIAAHTLEDAWELVETVESTGLTYMLAENYCYMRPNMMVGNMAAQGVFGDITYVEGAYLHDCRDLTCGPDGELTWRGKLQRDYNGMDYPTHSLGPVAQWIGINRTDELDFMSTYTSRTGSMNKYIRERFGDSHPGADPSYWNQGDSAVTTIRTKKGVLISLRLDWVSGRPHNMTHYALQGTRGAYAAAGDSIARDAVWIEGRSPGESPNGKGIPPARWESLENYREQYEHPLWQQWLTEAERAGHGGGDFFVIDEFVSAIQEKRPPAIDVYDAVTWSAVFPLSVQSVRDGVKPVSFPNFAKNKLLRK